MNLARNIVFEMVRGDILACRLMPGEELREGELAQRYGVSKSPVREAMRTIGRAASELRCAVHVEPITQFESRFCRSVADAAALCAAADSPHASLVLDTHNMNITEASIVGSMRAAGARIGHMHFADSNRLPPGHAHIEFGPILATLADLRYEGWISFECAFPGDFGATLRRCIDALRRTAEAI